MPHGGIQAFGMWKAHVLHQCAIQSRAFLVHGDTLKFVLYRESSSLRLLPAIPELVVEEQGKRRGHFLPDVPHATSNTAIPIQPPELLFDVPI